MCIIYKSVDDFVNNVLFVVSLKSECILIERMNSDRTNIIVLESV